MRVSLGMTVTCGVVFTMLSGLAVLGSWRQTEIVARVAADADKIDAYQEAILLSQREMELVQAVLNEPDGAERNEILALHDRSQASIDRLATTVDPEHRATANRVSARQAALRSTVRSYLIAIDEGKTAAAIVMLEQDVEPALDALASNLQTIAVAETAKYLTARETSEDDSRTLFWGSVLIFLLGLTVLLLYGLSSRAHRRQIERLASVDTLTGLTNRTAFVARVRDALAGRPDGRRVRDVLPVRAEARRAREAAGRAEATTVIVVNLDGFRDVNDQFGHRVGDLLLAEAGRRIAVSVRAEDTVSRLGGDDFAILLADAGPGLDEALAGRLREAFQAPFALDDVTVDIEVSCGAATAQPGEDAAAVLVHADLAMHDAKQHRSGFRRFKPEETQGYAARLTLLGDLRRALEHDDQLSLHYQPKIALDGGRITGVEALARWTHPVRGFVSPAEFIPVLETTGLMHDFTDWALAAALAQARRWNDTGRPLTVSVNISTRTLLDKGFPGRVADLLVAAGVPGELLCVEITEYTVMSDPETTIGALRRIRELGVKTSLDDYGTGYSSMAYLKTLPLDELKIDRTFVHDMSTDPGSLALVESAVTLGHKLGLSVVAEGIEDAVTAEMLSAIGCDAAQGYHFARPQPAADLPQLLLTPRP